MNERIEPVNTSLFPPSFPSVVGRFSPSPSLFSEVCLRTMGLHVHLALGRLVFPPFPTPPGSQVKWQTVCNSVSLPSQLSPPPAEADAIALRIQDSERLSHFPEATQRVMEQSGDSSLAAQNLSSVVCLFRASSGLWGLARREERQHRITTGVIHGECLASS